MDYKWALKKQVEHIRSVELAFSPIDIGALSSSDWPKSEGSQVIASGGRDILRKREVYEDLH